MSKRITILGSGESGTGAALLAKVKGFSVFVSDQAQIKDKYKQELIREEIPFEEGIHTLDRILEADLIIKSPGISPKAEVIKKAKEKGIEIVDELEFGFRFLQGKVIAITGTNGKTTTTLLTYHLLKEAGFNVALAGNVGESLARKVAYGLYDWYVIEISSFQLDGITSFQPEIGILLNITPDHLDRYEYKMENYVHSKFRLIEHMKPSGKFIYYADDEVTGREVEKRVMVPKTIPISLKQASTDVHFDGKQMVFKMSSGSFFIKQSDTTLKGPHNLINTMSAVTAAVLAGVSEEAIRLGLKTFKNAPHRLESIASIAGIEFVNDSKATNVDSVIYALGSYHQPLIWIAGGVDKGNDYRLIKEAVSEKVKVLICLGKENEKLKKFFTNIIPVIHETQSIKELVKIALSAGKAGDVVLLSPACASFDLFKNYEDRGTQFREAVLELKNQTQEAKV
jgi:UDP-N-acetylmuramoylalanine--D-glutamate ligase